MIDTVKHLAGSALAPWLAHRLRRASRRRGSALRDQVDLVLGSEGGPLGIRPLQVPAEILRLLEILAPERPRRLLEIGTASGGTLFLLCRAAAPDAVLASIDLPWGSGGGYRPWRERFYARFAAPGQQVVLLRGDSHSPAMLRQVESTFDGEALDFLLIDGDHSYEGARRDWETYGPLVRPGGLVAFHDIVPGSPSFVGGVPELWRELSGERPSQVLVHDWEQGGCGIGLLRA